jgi:hypothetical protein
LGAYFICSSQWGLVLVVGLGSQKECDDCREPFLVFAGVRDEDPVVSQSVNQCVFLVLGQEEGKCIFDCHWMGWTKCGSPIIGSAGVTKPIPGLVFIGDWIETRPNTGYWDQINLFWSNTQ